MKDEEKRAAICDVLVRWNPLGEAAKDLPDLDGYRTEAIDIFFNIHLEDGPVRPERIVMEVLNEAISLGLSLMECVAPAREIMAIAGGKDK